MTSSTRSLRVLRHGSETTIPEAEFNPDTDVRLDPEPATTDDPEAGNGQMGDSGTEPGEKAAGRGKKG